MRQIIIPTILLALTMGFASCGGGEREKAEAAYEQMREAVIEGDYDALIDMMRPDDKKICLAAGREELRRTQEQPSDEEREKWARHYGLGLSELLEMTPRQIVGRALQVHLGYSYTPDYFRTSLVTSTEPLFRDTARVHVTEQVGGRRPAFYDFAWIEGRWYWVFPGRAALDPGLLKDGK